ncbi:hypothetical protein Ari01nite_43160 [Paractinoplanes rishiriensis]|uniref:Ricin B lectin domain-containing protein n=2 Tax=Paractinoplanes rishiriensis TaxID=1050105 RepID=A0A919K579_9ACTN|nr:hypothetical protein Ari01nite_43160 [Actinoplanes rishiriensis]
MRLGAAVAAGLLAVALTPAGANAKPGDGWFAMVNQKNPGRYYMDVNPGVGSVVTVAGAQSGDGGNLQGRQEWRRVNFSDGTFMFRSAGTSNQFALSLAGNGYDNGTRVVSWWYQEDNPNQYWMQEKYWGSNIYQYRNLGASAKAHVSMCMAVAGAGDGSIQPGDEVIIFRCGSGADQQWYQYDN